jgi:hypothetical protein
MSIDEPDVFVERRCLWGGGLGGRGRRWGGGIGEARMIMGWGVGNDNVFQVRNTPAPHRASLCMCLATSTINWKACVSDYRKEIKKNNNK